MAAELSELDAYRERAVAARARLRSLPLGGRGAPGPVDEATGERWDRGNVLGHTAELLRFWCAQVEMVRGGAVEFGRGDQGTALRREGIDTWSDRDERELRLEIETGIETLLRLLDGLTPADLERRALYRSRAGDREVDLRHPLETLLVGHLEAHLRQLEELEPGGQAPGTRRSG